MILEAAPTENLDTAARLILAASKTFARLGLKGATTKQIAKEAGVNEVTLFRHFQSKENLLKAVLEQAFAERRPGSGPEPAVEEPADLRAALQRFAEAYAERLQRNVMLVRTLIGEIHQHGEYEARVLQGIFAPLKAGLVHTLESAQDRGLIRAEIEPVIAADLFNGAILADVLRRPSPHAPVYQREAYLAAAVDILLLGIKSAAPL
jgi:AcrR family transcriptional regulator